MSYDVSLSIEDAKGDGHTVLDENYTSNTWRMWTEAGCDLAKFNGVEGHVLERELGPAVHDMQLRPTHYKQWNPDNGWGDYDSTLVFLSKILDACQRWPNAIVHVSH